MRSPGFRNKVAAITGAASGIGRALAVDLAGRGCALALSDVDEGGLEVLAEELRRSQGAPKVTCARVDVADAEAVAAWAESTAAEHGRVHLIYNNAGVAQVGSVIETGLDDLAWLMQINFWGVIHGTKAFLPHLLAAGDGQVVNISSVFGIVGIPNQSAYNAAKFAVRGYTEALRIELDSLDAGVSATCVHPGGIATNISRTSRVVATLADHKDQIDAQFERVARTSPERAARVINEGVARNRRRVLVGVDARLIDVVQRFAPAGYQRLVRRVIPTSLRPK